MQEQHWWVRISVHRSPIARKNRFASRRVSTCCSLELLAYCSSPVRSPLVSLFTTDPEVLEHGTRALWIVSLAFPLYAAGMCLEAAFNGAGDTWTPTRLNFFCFWLGQVPLAWILAEVLALGPVGRLHFRTHIILSARAVERRAFQARPLEAAEGVKVARGAPRLRLTLILELQAYTY